MSEIQTNDTILITGGTGFVGSHLQEALWAKGCTNIHITSTRDIDFMNAKVHPVDLTDRAATHSLFEKLHPQWIFHLASYAIVSNSFENQHTIYQQNALIQEHVLEATKLFAPTARFLNVSSGEIYGKSIDAAELPITESHVFRPSNPYAVSKIYQDSLAYMYSLAHHLNIVRARPFNHIGERQSNKFVVPSIAEQIAKIEKGLQTKLNIGNTEAIRDFSDVKDVVQAYILLIEKGDAGETYNIGSGKGHSIQDVLEMLVSLSSVNITVEVDSERLRPSDIPVMIASIQKINALGWHPTIPLHETVVRILEFWRKRV